MCGQDEQNHRLPAMGGQLCHPALPTPNWPSLRPYAPIPPRLSASTPLWACPPCRQPVVSASSGLQVGARPIVCNRGTTSGAGCVREGGLTSSIRLAYGWINVAYGRSGFCGSLAGLIGCEWRSGSKPSGRRKTAHFTLAAGVAGFEGLAGVADTGWPVAVAPVALTSCQHASFMRSAGPV